MQCTEYCACRKGEHITGAIRAGRKPPYFVGRSQPSITSKLSRDMIQHQSLVPDPGILMALGWNAVCPSEGKRDKPIVGWGGHRRVHRVQVGAAARLKYLVVNFGLGQASLTIALDRTMASEVG